MIPLSSGRSTKSKVNVTGKTPPLRNRLDQLVEFDACTPSYVSWDKKPINKLYCTLSTSHCLFLERNLYAWIVSHETSNDWLIQSYRAKSNHMFDISTFLLTLQVFPPWSLRLRFACLMPSRSKLMQPSLKWILHSVLFNASFSLLSESIFILTNLLFRQSLYLFQSLCNGCLLASSWQ